MIAFPLGVLASDGSHGYAPGLSILGLTGAGGAAPGGCAAALTIFSFGFCRRSEPRQWTGYEMRKLEQVQI